MVAGKKGKLQHWQEGKGGELAGREGRRVHREGREDISSKEGRRVGRKGREEGRQGEG